MDAHWFFRLAALCCLLQRACLGFHSLTPHRRAFGKYRSEPGGQTIESLEIGFPNPSAKQIVRLSASTSDPSAVEHTAGRPARILPNERDMEHLAFILANMTDCLDAAPEQALTIASQEMGWLYARDVPKLTEMLLNKVPVLREDQAMMRAYLFLIDFLEAVSKETSKKVKQNQNYLRHLLEATKTSEKELDRYIKEKREKLISADFMIYLDTEIENQETNSQWENLLVTIKLRLLDEQGKNLGVDVALLPKLAAEVDPAELRRKTTAHLDSYDAAGKALFLQTLKILMSEMNKRYENLDPIMLMNLKEVQKITEAYIKKSNDNE